MWCLTSSTGAKIYLVGKLVYTIGRKNNDIVIQNDDSISRNHAQIYIKSEGLVLVDMGSKYGTYVESEKLAAKIEKDVPDGSEVRFGVKQSTFRLTQIIFKTYTSNLSSNDKPLLQSYLTFLKGTMSQDWSSSCTHLTATTIKLTVRVLCALTNNQPIVTIGYWRDCVEAVKSNSELPDVKNYKPDVYETLFNKNVSLDYKEERRKLFEGKIFVFLTKKAMDGIENIIRITGGQSVLLENSELTLNKLKSDNPEYILIEEADYTDKDSKIYKCYQNTFSYLRKLGKRSIPFQEIALAVLFCSCEQNCNPKFDRKKALLDEASQPSKSSEILAMDTELNTQRSQFVCTQRTIPETEAGPSGIARKVTESTQSSYKISENMTSQEAASTQISVTDSLNFSEPTQKRIVEPSTSSQQNMEVTAEKSQKFKPNNIEEDVFKSPFSRKRSSDNSLEHPKKKTLVTNPFAMRERSSNTEREISEMQKSCSELHIDEGIDEVDKVMSSTLKHKDVPKMHDPNLSAISISGWISRGEKVEKEVDNSVVKEVKPKPTLVENPFGKKRKPSEDLGNLSKRSSRPMSDISNTQPRPFSTLSSFSSNLTDDTRISADGWISRADRSIKQENITCEEEDEAVRKWRDSLRDCVIVSVIDIEIKREKSIVNETTGGGKNFKKFRKVHPKHYQTHIIPASDYEIVVCGENSVMDISNDIPSDIE